jgi:tetratricopeptide (TPR) repeat protein
MHVLQAACVVALVLACSAVASTQAPATNEIAPARTGLRAIPLPRLDDLEPAVADQIREQESGLRALVESGTNSGSKLASGYGQIAKVFHAYEFFDSAEAAYLNAVRLAPNDAGWLHLLGYLYQQAGRLEAAADHFEQTLRVQPDDRAAAVRLGQVYLGLNRLREAREQFQNVEAAFPMLSRNGLGEVALRERRYDEAVSHFRAVLERVPQATSVHYSLAMAYRGLGRLDDARSELERRGPGGLNVGDPIVDSLQALIRGERGLVAQGRKAYEAGQYQDAAAAFAKAIEAVPSSATARVNLGLTQLQLGNTAAAIATLQQAFELAPEDTNASRELVRVLLRAGRSDDAIRVLAKAHSVNSTDEETVVGLSILLAQQNRFREAVALLAEGNQRFPERTATATTLARLLASSPDRSVRDGQRALDLANAVHRAEPTPVHGETIALALAELGRCDDAVSWIKRAVNEAEQEGDAAETARLKGEVVKYERVPCAQ